ncbi:sensor histidine kinase [Streptomyces iconiensis]|uniref:histidine kinase n=1 Tax=Streptomyces iconiensis TaxID=1384038 RepID=A0ABT6ZZW5_9ACTN|nr:HAMP domain-containing sensor histidine kinase [Streptomyces iconiensis]MDJ1134334.1 HAMP domain-containing sensor histidine kinase [Streptomyces iconiensis]
MPDTVPGAPRTVSETPDTVSKTPHTLSETPDTVSGPVCRPIRWSARLRLTLMYGALFLVSGAALLASTFVLVAQSPVSKDTRVRAAWGSAGPMPGAPSRFRAQIEDVVSERRSAELRTLLTESGVALGGMTAVSVALGWLMAGRVLRPVRTMADKARRISERNLHERLAVAGPSDELKDLGDTFDGLLARLDAAFEAQKRFVANASHELRTPLTLQRAMIEVALAAHGAGRDARAGPASGADPVGETGAVTGTASVTDTGVDAHVDVVAMADAAAETDGKAKAHAADVEADAAAEADAADVEALREVCRRVLAAGESQERLIEALLTLASGQRGLDPERAGPVDLAMVARNVLRDREDARTGTALAPAATRGDAALVERLVINLVENALRYTPGHGWIHLSTGTSEGRPFLHVANSGEVMDPARIPLLYQPFQRLGPRGSSEGHGLGLSIVDAVATAHGARVTTVPGPEGGLAITVTFPVGRATWA